MGDRSDSGQDTDGTPGEPGGQGASELDVYEARISPFVERFAADLTQAGMQRMASRVFACLLASRSAALSSTDLAERLQCSPAAISGAVRYLANLHLVSREREPGSRRERYHLHEDIWHETFLTRNRFVSRWSTTLQAGIDTLGPDTPEGRRLRETIEFFDFLQEELGSMLDRWRKHREDLDGHPDT